MSVALLQAPLVVPTAVYVIWAIALAIVILVVIPLTVYLLHRTLTAARNIEQYLAEMRDAGVGIANNTDHVAGLDDTIEVAGQILETAGAIEEHAATIETTLEARAGSDGQGRGG